MMNVLVKLSIDVTDAVTIDELNTLCNELEKRARNVLKNNFLGCDHTRVSFDNLENIPLESETEEE